MVLTSAAASRPQQRRSPAPLAALAFAVGLAAPALAQERAPTAVEPPPLERTPRGRAGAPAPGEADPTRPFPQVSLDVNLNFYGIGTPGASEPNREGVSSFIFGHINPGFHLTPDFSVQGFIHPDPAGDFEPNGAVTFLRRQNVILEQLFAEWRPAEGFQVYGGKFNAPFGYGYEYFPGVLASFRAHDVYLVREVVGGGANWTLPLPERWGEHTLAAAVFTLDTSFASNSGIVRQRCCDPGFGRYVRTTLRAGGAGNTGNLDNFAVSIEGSEMAALPGVTYNLGLLSRGPGKDATRREWGLAAGLRHERAWTDAIKTLAFGEFVDFRNSGGNPVEEAEDGGSGAVSERRRFWTVGAQVQSGLWRATLVWQRDEAKRSFNPLPRQNFYEASVGRSLARGFGLDLGYQYAQIVRDDLSPGFSHSVVARLNYSFTH